MRSLITAVLVFFSIALNAQFTSNYQIIHDVDKTKTVEANSTITLDVINTSPGYVLLRIGEVEYRDTIVRMFLYKVKENIHTYRISTKEGDYFFKIDRNTQKIIEAEWRPYGGLITVYKNSKA